MNIIIIFQPLELSFKPSSLTVKLLNILRPFLEYFLFAVSCFLIIQIQPQPNGFYISAILGLTFQSSLPELLFACKMFIVMIKLLGTRQIKRFFFQELVSFYSIGLAETTIEKDDFESVQTMAKRYVQLIKTEQSTGPYYLGKSEVCHITICATRE